MHTRYAIYSSNEQAKLPDALKSDLDYAKINVMRKCEEEVDAFVNEFRSTLGVDYPQYCLIG
jgi:hypothetical protein